MLEHMFDTRLHDHWDPPRCERSRALVERMCGSWRVEARAAADRLDAIGELFELRRAQRGEQAEWAVDTWAAVGAEVAAAFRISLAMAGSYLRYALAVRERLPRVAGVFRGGDIDYRMFQTLAYRTGFDHRLGVTTEQLAEILWRGADWPPHWGMYVSKHPDGDEPVIPRSLRLRPASIGSEILGGYMQIAGWEYLLAFERPPVDHVFRPAGMAFQRVGFPVRCCKMVAFAWPEQGHSLIDVVSAVPPSEDFSKPSNPRAAAMHKQIRPGSLNVTSVRK
jgi:hypothetical protein